jgi:hypothetical protein
MQYYNQTFFIVNRLDEEELFSPESSVNIDLDERLIMAVIDRPPLYDHRLNIKERSKAKKAALWEEVKNTIDSMYIYIYIYKFKIFYWTFLLAENLLLIITFINKIFIVLFKIV